MQQVENYERLVAGLVNNFHKKNPNIANGDKDDIMNTARIAAWKALKKFRKERNTKIESFIASCVINRLKDIKRHAKNNEWLTYPDQIYEIETDHSWLLDLELDAQEILNAKEYIVFTQKAYGCTLKEIAEEMNVSIATAHGIAKSMVQKLRDR